MAFIAFDNGPGFAMPHAEVLPASTHPAVPERTERDGTAEELSSRLSALEWLVVALARKDHPISLRQPGRLATAVRNLFRHPDPILADVRLEALRRIAVLSWTYGASVPVREIDAFLHAGFTAGQYETVLASIGVAKARADRQVAW